MSYNSACHRGMDEEKEPVDGKAPELCLAWAFLQWSELHKCQEGQAASVTITHPPSSTSWPSGSPVNGVQNRATENGIVI